MSKGGEDSEVGREEMSEGKGRWGGVGRERVEGKGGEGGRKRGRLRASKR